MKHNHSPVEWCSRCPSQWLLADVPGYYPTTENHPISLQPLIDVVRKGVEDLAASNRRWNQPNITKTPMRITTEFGSIRP